MNKEGRLKGQILFEELSDKDIKKIEGLLTELRIKKGDYVFREGEDTKGIYLIMNGKIEIFKSTVDGWKQTLSVLGDGNFFGELSIIEDRRHEANAIAHEDSEVLLFRKEDFKRLEEEDLELAIKVLKKLVIILSKNLRRMNDMFLKAIVSY
jgi:CRP-like cAMP-binding protein